MISRFKGLSFTETETNIRDLSLKVRMSLMAKACIILLEVMCTQEASKMAGFMVMGPMLSLMAPYYTQGSGKRPKSMELESLDYLMEAFTEAPLKPTNSMASVSNASQTMPFTKAIMRTTKESASSSSPMRRQPGAQPGTPLRPSTKMTMQRDSSHFMRGTQARFGSRFLRIRSTA